MTRDDYDKMCSAGEQKTCRHCNCSIPVSGFSLQKTRSGNLRLSSWCRKCHYQSVNRWESKNISKVREYRREYYEKNADKYKSRARENRIKRVYGISQDEFESMLASQGGVCAICHKKSDRFCIDHGHSSGKVRGILCNGCNSAIGLLRESRENLDRAKEYLARASCP